MATLSVQDILNAIYDGTNFNIKVDQDVVALNATVRASAALTATANESDQTVPSHTVKGVRIYLDITTVTGTTPTLDVKVELKDPVRSISGVGSGVGVGSGSRGLVT